METLTIQITMINNVGNTLNFNIHTYQILKSAGCLIKHTLKLVLLESDQVMVPIH